MPLTLSLNHPDFPQGHEFAIPGVGVVPNGGSIELTEDQELSFISSEGRTLEDSASDTLSVSGSTSVENVDEVLQNIGATSAPKALESKEASETAVPPSMLPITEQPKEGDS